MTTSEGLIDIHVHAYIWPGPRGFSTAEVVLERYDEAGIQMGVILPLVSPEVYLPQSNEEVLAIVEAHPDRFVAFCNIDPRAMTNSAAAPLGELLAYYKERGCRGVGEVMPNMPFLDPLVQNLFRHVEGEGLPLTFDMSTRIGGAYGLFDEPGLPQLEDCLKRFEDLVFLGHGPPFWAEISKLRDPSERSGYPGGPVDEGRVPELMRRYDNLWGDLSAYSGYNALARDMEYAAEFLEEFEDRLLFGTDICAPDTPLWLPPLLRQMRETGAIGRRTYRKIARKNAQRLLSL